MSALAQAWITLQNNFEQYEKWCLWIKLMAVALTAASMMGLLPWKGATVLLLMLWLQEGILRTSQSRLGAHLLQLEQRHAQHADMAAGALTLHTEWQANRPGIVGLVAEYLRNALRPTVAYPYALLVLLPLFNRLLHG